MRPDPSRRPRSWLLITLVLLAPLVAAAFLRGGVRSGKAERPPLNVAAASDLQLAFTELGREFEKESAQRVTFSFGSTGNLARQIEHGAPFDAFFAANEQFVSRLADRDLLLPGTQRAYATGVIVLASNTNVPFEARTLTDLLDPRVKRVAIANPEHAPYGLAAREALQAAGVWERLQPKLVLGENIRQTLQFIQTGNADAGIVALSVAKAPQVRHRAIDAQLYTPLKQTAAVIRGARSADTAQRFLDFVCSERGQAVMQRYGFLPLGPQ